MQVPALVGFEGGLNKKWTVTPVMLRSRRQTSYKPPPPTTSPRRPRTTPSLRVAQWILHWIVIITCCAQLIHNLKLYQDFRRMIWNPDSFNTHCLDHPQLHYCQPTPHQFDKFIWFVTDGFSFNYGMNSIKEYSDHSVTYTVNVPGYKFSDAIYTSWLTGQAPYNYFGRRIVGDQLIDSYWRSRTKRQMIDKPIIRYEGPEGSLLTIAGYGKKEITGHASDEDVVGPDPKNIFDVHSIEEDFSKDKGYSTLRDGKLETVLKEIKVNEQSMISYTGVFDKYQHHFASDNLQCTRGECLELDELAKEYNVFLISLKDFIDNNPEYLLILSSDHGIDEPNHLHGNGVDVNIGYIMFYNPKLNPSDMKKIDVVDVAPTFAGYIKGLDVPINSIGVSQAYFGDTEEDLLEYKQNLKKNLVQLQKAAEIYNVKVHDPEVIRKLVDDDIENDISLERLLSESQKIKDMIFRDEFNFGIINVSFNIILLAILQCFLLFRLKRKDVGFVSCLVLIVVFGQSYISFAFAWNQFGKIYQGGAVFFVMHIGLAMLNFVYRPEYQEMVLRIEKMILVVFVIHYILEFLQVKLLSTISGIVGWLLFCWFLKSNSGKFQSIFAITCCALSFGYYMSSAVNFLYFIMGFHVLAFAVYVLGTIFIFVSLFANNLESVAVGAFVLLQFIYGGDITLALLYEMGTAYLRKLDSIGIRSPREHLPRIANEKSKSSVFLRRHIYIAFLASLPLLWNSFVISMPPNFAVTPELGAVGISSRNLYPILSACLMIFRRYGAGWCWLIYIAVATKSSRLVLGYLCLNAAITGFAFVFVLRFYTVAHLLEECLALEIFHVVSCILYALLCCKHKTRKIKKKV